MSQFKNEKCKLQIDIKISMLYGISFTCRLMWHIHIISIICLVECIVSVQRHFGITGKTSLWEALLPEKSI